MEQNSPTGRDQILKRRRNRWILIPGAIVVIVALLLTYRFIERKRLQTADAASKTAAVMPVRVMEVTLRDVPNLIQHSGVIRAWQQANILSEVAGKVKSINAKVGDRLAIGHEILKLDDELLTYTVEQAAANVLQLEANFQTSKRELARKRSLYNNKVISVFEFDIAEAKEKADRARLQSAQAQLKIAQRDLRLTSITSPIDGILADRLVDIGSNVARGQPTATVVEIEQIKVNVGISEKDIAAVREGLPVEIMTDAYPAERYQGTVYSVGTKADDMTLTFPVAIMAVNNREPILKPGMVAKVIIRTGTFHDVIALPQDAVIKNDGQQYIWTAVDSRAHRVIITPRAVVGSLVIINSGLAAGQLVVVSGQGTLFEGCPVQIVADQQAEQLP